MNKEELKNRIIKRLKALGLNPVIDGPADLTVDDEFLGSDCRKGRSAFEFHNSCILDEKEKILYYWESIKETGLGFSPGVGSDTVFSPNTALTRSVKRVQYGPGCKIYEYDLELMDITKVYKNAAQTNGWEFRFVSKKDAACFVPRQI